MKLGDVCRLVDERFPFLESSSFSILCDLFGDQDRELKGRYTLYMGDNIKYNRTEAEIRQCYAELEAFAHPLFLIRMDTHWHTGESWITFHEKVNLRLTTLVATYIKTRNIGGLDRLPQDCMDIINCV
jgi:hypothetical protein